MTKNALKGIKTRFELKCQILAESGRAENPDSNEKMGNHLR